MSSIQKNESHGKDLLQVQKQEELFDRRQWMHRQQGRQVRSENNLVIDPGDEWPFALTTSDASTTLIDKDPDGDDGDTMFSFFQWSTASVGTSTKSQNLDHNGSNHSRRSSGCSDGCTGGKRAPSNLKSSKSIMRRQKKKTLRKTNSSKELTRYV